MKSPLHGVTRFPVVALVEDGQESLGCIVVPFKVAASTSLLVGDYVYMSTTSNAVTKSATVANYTGTRVGIVVGGDSLLGSFSEDYIVFDPSLVGQPAATAGQNVWVAVGGVAYGIANAALSTVGSRVIAGATAGRLAAGTTAGGIIGITIEPQANAGGPVKILIQPS